MDKPVVISVKNVSKSFNLPHERFTGLKQALINFRFGKRYDEQQVLKNISFDIHEGEFFGIVGRNGSGKSTLLKLLAQIYTPNKGKVSVRGTLTPFIELGVGFNPELTGRENVYLNGALLGFDRKQMSAMYQGIVEFAELGEFMDQKLKNYSSGMQVRLAFSIAIRAKSDILLIDEVLAVGDVAFQQKCFSYFEQMKREGRTIVFVTHDMSAVNRFCTRALIIEKGRIKKIGAPSEVADVYVLDNIETPVQDDTASASDNHKFKKPISSLDLKLTSKAQVKNTAKLTFEVSYKLNSKIDPVLGFSILKDGQSVAEMNSKPLALPSEPGVVHKAAFETSLTAFNPGLYTIDIAIFDRPDFALLGYRLKSAEYAIEGSDQTRGGIVHLDGAWTLR